MTGLLGFPVRGGPSVSEHTADTEVRAARTYLSRQRIPHAALTNSDVIASGGRKLRPFARDAIRSGYPGRCTGGRGGRARCTAHCPATGPISTVPSFGLTAGCSDPEPSDEKEKSPTPH